MRQFAENLNILFYDFPEVMLHFPSIASSQLTSHARFLKDIVSATQAPIVQQTVTDIPPFSELPSYDQHNIT